MGRGKPDGPGGVLIKELHLDFSNPEYQDANQPWYCYLQERMVGRGSLREVTMVQLFKYHSSDRFVHALLLERTDVECYRRIGVARLGNYNLAPSCLPDRRRQGPGARIVAYLHPREMDGAMHELKNREWELEKWVKRRLKVV